MSTIILVCASIRSGQGLSSCDVGTIKYHRSGRRLSEGILRQVETLVKALSTAKAIQMIRVNFVDRTNGDLPSTQRVLEPFVGLTNVCGNFVMTGAVSGDMARWCGAKQR